MRFSFDHVASFPVHFNMIFLITITGQGQNQDRYLDHKKGTRTRTNHQDQK